MAQSRPFVTVFGMASDDQQVGDDAVNITKTAVEAVRQGYAVVPLRPGTKVPDLCTLTARDLKAAGPNHTRSGECGVNHFMTDDVVVRRVFDRLGKTYDRPLNLGIVVGPSHLINIDADQAEAVKAFQNDWATAEGDPGYLAHEPTVSTPGAFRDGEWRHKGGGHYYFLAPEGFDFTEYRSTVIKATGGYDVRFGLQMCVAPPSTRSEGPYVAHSDVLPCPQFIIDMIEASRVRHEERAARVRTMKSSSIGEWASAVSWDDLLVADGWRNTSKVDVCGCPVFEKPGGGSTTDKSATGHENTCVRWENVENHGPLHVWTTDPPEELTAYATDHMGSAGFTITKLTYVAETRHEGDVVAAKDALGILDDDETDTGISDWLTEDVTNVTAPASDPSESSHDDRVTECDDPGTLGVPEPSQASQVDPEQFMTAAMERFHHPANRSELVGRALAKALDERVAREAADEYIKAISGASVESLLDVIGAFATESFEIDTDTVPEFLVRTDGACLYHRGRTNWLVGRRGSGKTWLSIFTLGQVLDGGGSAIYFDFEDRRELFYERAAAIGLDLETPRREGRFVYVKEFPTNAVDLPAFVERVGKFDLAVFDVINRMVSRLGGNPDSGNEQVIWLTDNLFDPLAAQDTAVLILDHPNKKGQAREATVEELNPGGGAMKGNNASGIMLGMQVSRPFTRTNPEGHIRLFCLKDRTGHYQEMEPVGEFRGSMDILEATAALGLALRVDGPDAEVESDRGIQGDIDAVKARIVAVLSDVGRPMKPGYFKGRITASLRDLMEIALDDLVAEGVLAVGDDGAYVIVEAK